jgi:photosystem II stability/assembly factor-like uncharacterized protein
MVGRLGWAVGSSGIYATTDGTHWGLQLRSDEAFGGVDFISATTGWAVGIRHLFGTTDGGAHWTAIGQGPKPIRSVHFATATQGWGIAGGANIASVHGWLIPAGLGTLVRTTDGGHTWQPMNSPADPQTVCFTDPSLGWLGTASGGVYRSVNGGTSWQKVLQRGNVYGGIPQTTLIECAGPSALWVDFEGGPAAAGHIPYIAYATQDGQHWQAVLGESMTEGSLMPGLPAGPDSYPGSFSVIDPQHAAFVGDGPIADRASTVMASSDCCSRTATATGAIRSVQETFGAAFVSATTGWVIVRTDSNAFAIEVTRDGGWTWTPQLTVAA